MMYRRKIVLLILILVLSACYRSTPENNNAATYGGVGVILTGTLEEYGWNNAHIQSENYATTTIAGRDVMIYFFVLSQPMDTFIESLSAQGARAIFTAPGVISSDVESQHPNIIFIHNVAARADVERMVPTLNLTIFPATPSPEVKTTDTSGVIVVIISILIVMAFLSLLTRRVIRSAAVPAETSSTVLERLIDRIATGNEPEKRKKKRSTLANSSVHGKAVRIQDRVEARKTDFAALGLPDPIIHKLTTYVQGYKHFDMSFGIETATDEFLGECGIGLSAALPYDRDKGVAFEIWLFDKNDIKTVSHTVGSVLALSDENMQKVLKNKGPIDVIEPDCLWTLETKTLRLDARILDVEYAYSTSDLPPNSTFEHVVFEIAVWRK
jgi:hypothetical protein